MEDDEGETEVYETVVRLEFSRMGPFPRGGATDGLRLDFAY